MVELREFHVSSKHQCFPDMNVSAGNTRPAALASHQCGHTVGPEAFGIRGRASLLLED